MTWGVNPQKCNIGLGGRNFWFLLSAPDPSQCPETPYCTVVQERSEGSQRLPIELHPEALVLLQEVLATWQCQNLDVTKQLPHPGFCVTLRVVNRGEAVTRMSSTDLEHFPL